MRVSVEFLHLIKGFNCNFRVFLVVFVHDNQETIQSQNDIRVLLTHMLRGGRGSHLQVNDGSHRQVSFIIWEGDDGEDL